MGDARYKCMLELKLGAEKRYQRPLCFKSSVRIAEVATPGQVASACLCTGYLRYEE